MVVSANSNSCVTVFLHVDMKTRTCSGGDPSCAKPKSLDFVQTIGVGTFGKISVIRYNSGTTCRPFALKQVAKSNLLDSKRGVESAITERNVLRQLSHPFLMHAHETWQDMNYIYFVMDFASGGDLFSKLQKGEVFSELRICQYVAQISLAIDYLHSQQILYRDVKAENVLIDSQGFIKLTDFGLSKFCQSVEGRLRAFTICGTPEYMAPELIENRGIGYGRKADWWAVGVLMYEMMYGMPPFYDADSELAMQAVLTEDVQFPMTPFFSDLAKHFVSELLVKNEHARLGNDHIFSHVFVSQLDLNAVYDKRIQVEYIPALQSAFDCSNFDDVHEEYNEAQVDTSTVEVPGFQWLPRTKGGGPINVSQR